MCHSKQQPNLKAAKKGLQNCKNLVPMPTRSENGTYQHDVVYFILIFNQNDKNVYF